MDRLVFLDTETTGIDLLLDRLFQVAYKKGDKLISSYFKPPIPISVKSMSISHVTNKMVEGELPFAGSQIQSDLKKLFPSHILVAHNAVFDAEILHKEGVTIDKFIDTLKVVRFLDQENPF